jgi:3-hydroxyisobutyrate dehydrogenase-like beta-hydroxyacid dehydrogenase
MLVLLLAAQIAVGDTSLGSSCGTIGFIGSAGIMGRGMSSRLLYETCHEVIVWNRDPEKSKASCLFAQKTLMLRCKVATSPREVAERGNIILSMLPTPEAANNVFFGSPLGGEVTDDATEDDDEERLAHAGKVSIENSLLAGVRPGLALVDCATLQEADMTRMAAAWTKGEGRFLEAPVSGSKGPAAAGSLVFLAAGDESVFTEAVPLLETMGKRSFFLGDSVGKGTRMKLVVNKMMVEMMATLSEGIATANHAGLSAADLIDVIGEGAMANPMFALKGPKINAGNFAPHFPLKHAKKDLLFALEMSKSFGMPEETRHMGEAARTVVEQALEDDPGRLLLDSDFSALAMAYTNR